MGVDAPERRAVAPGSAGLTGVRLHTRMPVSPAWLARHVVPVARALVAQGAPAVQLRRGWLHGPYVDILALTTPGLPGPDWAEVAARLDAGPLDPPRALTEEQYLAQAREFGRLEAVPPPYLPLREHGAVERVERTAGSSAEPRLDPFRTVVAGALAKPLLSMIEAIAADPRSATARLAEAFAALADTHALGLAYGVFSPRSHVEAFLAWAAPTKDVRPVFEERYARDRQRLRTVVEQRVSGEVSPAAAEWRTAFAYCAGALENAVAAGTLTLDLLDSATAGLDKSEMGPPGAVRTVPQGAQPDSDFHRAVDASGVVADPSKWFAAFRLLTNLFYEQLPLLTVSPMQRYYMCFAIAETVDAVLGVSWQERLRERQDRGAHGGHGSSDDVSSGGGSDTGDSTLTETGAPR